ncbi:MAG: hypothetical protein KGL39_59215 [Patescibacteria group bacterium]|nr:hypothetical protein [Patescibacteria group bacterium]
MIASGDQDAVPYGFPYIGIELIFDKEFVRECSALEKFADGIDDPLAAARVMVFSHRHAMVVPFSAHSGSISFSGTKPRSIPQ